ncbi:MAG TPA: DUF362 domain-containing protein [Polyangiaceae bacterium]|nr:DUF362 domain-containing protein [Polyangiaceae bacterium]
MSSLLSLNQRRSLLGLLLAMAGVQSQSCANDPGNPPGQQASAGRGGVPFGGGGREAPAGAPAAGTSAGGAAGRAALGGAAGTASAGSNGGAPTGGMAGASAGAAGYAVSIVQSDKAQASELTQDDVRSLVTEAVTQAGGLDFIKDGQTVVLKPNLLTTTSGSTLLAATVNGITTDWRVAHAVAALVRARNPSGKILVMEGSIESTTQAYSRMGYTPQNFGTLVDEFIALEGASCSKPSADGLVQKSAAGGKLYWVNQRFFAADVVISLAVLKTHFQAGITGSVKNLGIGATPANKYSNNGCGRTQTAAYIDHGRAGLAAFIHDFYSVRPADFAIIDGLQGVQNGPNPAYVQGGNYDADRMNMRLVMASKNAVALDAIEAQVMGCDPKGVDYLLKLDQSGFGTSDTSKITVLGKAVSAVRREFKGPEWACGNP